jgi:hypothetical protein
MIINALLAFALVGWSRLSESNRRPVHYEKHAPQHQTRWLHR